MKTLVTGLFLLTASIAFSGPVGFLTREAQDWSFIQAVGGMKVSVWEGMLLVECDVSGLRKVTVKPTRVNSGIGVRQLRHRRTGNTIALTIVPSALEKGMKTTPKPVDVSRYPAGEYEVQYLDPDGTKHTLGKIRVHGENAGSR